MPITGTEASRRYSARHPERVAASKRKYVKNQPEKVAASKRRNDKKYAVCNPEKILAHNAVTNAIRAGILVRPNACSVFGKPHKLEAHHPNYTRPLNIVWLCRPCHYVADGIRRKFSALEARIKNLEMQKNPMHPTRPNAEYRIHSV